MRPHSLHLRLAASFAALGALTSLILSAGIFLFAHQSAQKLIDETLRAELQDYLERVAANPAARLPATLTLAGYVLDGSDGRAVLPAPLRTLAAGRHDVELGGRPYRVLVAERRDRRYIFLFDETLQRHRERRFAVGLVAGSLALTAISALFGMWLARRIAAPITQLAAIVGTKGADDPPHGLPTDSSLIEVSELATAFEHHLSRIRHCMLRERMFTADVSHELRTPLAIIRGAVEMLERDSGLDDKQRERVARIDRASLDMVELASALLHLAREENVRVAAAGDCDLAEVIRESVDRHRALARAQGREFFLATHPTVRAPIARILAVTLVDNLLGNALHHGRSGPVHIHLDAHRLTVSDAGPGIAADDIGRVFEPHHRGAHSDGAGIGLSLVKRICDLHGWQVRLSTTAGKGTTVSVAWPSSPNLDLVQTNS
jgi:signal transduction histidine kinase